MKKNIEKKKDDDYLEFEKYGGDGNNSRYILKLYITGTTPNSIKSINNLKKICEEYLKNRYELEIIDIYQQPVLATGEQIIAAPTLVKKLPLPIRKLIGDLSNTDRVLMGLDLKKKN